MDRSKMTDTTRLDDAIRRANWYRMKAILTPDTGGCFDALADFGDG